MEWGSREKCLPPRHPRLDEDEGGPGFWCRLGGPAKIANLRATSPDKSREKVVFLIGGGVRQGWHHKKRVI